MRELILPSAQRLRDIFGELGPSPSFTEQERHWYTEPKYKERQSAVSALSGEQKAQGDPILVYKYLMEEVKKTEPDSSQWYPE